MPILFPFAVHVQQSEKQQVSNCCVLKGIMKNNEKKYDENWNMDVDNTKQIPHRIYSKKKFYRCEPDHTIEHAQWSHPRKLILVNLLVGRTKTLSFRQDRLPLSGIAEAVEKTKRESKRERREHHQIIHFQMQMVHSKFFHEQWALTLILPRRWKQKYFSDWHWLTAIEGATFLYLSFLCNTIKKESCKNIGNLQKNTLDSYFKGSCV